MKCMGNCPQKAIETGHGYIVAFALFFSNLFIGIFYHYSSEYFFDIENKPYSFIVESLLALLLLFAWYRIIHYLMRFRIVERLVVFSSLTKFKFWGRRYKALKDY